MGYLEILRKQRHPVRFLLSRALMKSGLSHHLTIPRDGYNLRFYPTPRTAELWIDRSAPRVEEPFIEAYLKPGDTVIDIGANIGELALRISGLVGAGGRVIAIEAHPRIFGYLEGNVAANRAANIECLNYAVSNSGGTIRFSDNRWDELNSIVSGPEEVPHVEVPAIRLDDLPRSLPRVDLLKIDVEGAEKFVLEGAGEMLRRTGCVYFESNESHFARNGYSCAGLFTLFAFHGFRIFRPEGENALSPLPAGYSSRVNENLIAARDPDALLRRTGYSPA